MGEVLGHVLSHRSDNLRYVCFIIFIYVVDFLTLVRDVYVVDFLLTKLVDLCNKVTSHNIQFDNFEVILVSNNLSSKRIQFATKSRIKLYFTTIKLDRIQCADDKNPLKLPHEVNVSSSRAEVTSVRREILLYSLLVGDRLAILGRGRTGGSPKIINMHFLA